MKPLCETSLLPKRSGYALELSFDQGLEERVRAVWSELARSGVDDFMSSLPAHPHISLVIYAGFTASPSARTQAPATAVGEGEGCDAGGGIAEGGDDAGKDAEGDDAGKDAEGDDASEDDAGVREAVRRVAEFARSVPPLPITLSSVGVFAGHAGVVFFGAVVTEELLRVHALSSQLLGDVGQGAWTYYCEGVWVPHCTLTQDMPEDRIPDAVEIAHRAPLPLHGRLVAANLVKFYPPEVLFSAPLSGPSDVEP